jgi:hypothetical protein
LPPPPSPAARSPAIRSDASVARRKQRKLATLHKHAADIPFNNPFMQRSPAV